MDSVLGVVIMSHGQPPPIPRPSQQYGTAVYSSLLEGVLAVYRTRQEAIEYMLDYQEMCPEEAPYLKLIDNYPF
jgi:hypothetical protein